MNTRTLNIRVAGVTYENRQSIIAGLLLTDPARIVPEPENPYDPNALAVHVAHEGKVSHVGYIPRDMAAQIAPVIDGESFDCTIAEITGGFMLPDDTLANYGLRLRVELPDEAGAAAEAEHHA